MAAVFDWIAHLHTPDGLRALIAAGGLLVLAGIIFAETGILAGFFLPGDSLLVTAGVFCGLDPTDLSRPPPLDLATTMAVLCVAAVAGDQLNFLVGKLTGDRAWQWSDGRFFKRRHLVEAHAWYERHGGIAIAGCRFVPIARTFVPFVAGVARMPFRSFVAWNVAGGCIWVCSLLLLGWWLGGNAVLRERLHLLILAVVAVSLVPLAVGALRRLRTRPAPAEG